MKPLWLVLAFAALSSVAKAQATATGPIGELDGTGNAGSVTFAYSLLDRNGNNISFQCQNSGQSFLMYGYMVYGGKAYYTDWYLAQEFLRYQQLHNH